MAKRKNLERDIQIYKIRSRGITCRELANEYGISPERIRQIFNIMKARMEKVEMARNR